MDSEWVLYLYERDLCENIILTGGIINIGYFLWSEKLSPTSVGLNYVQQHYLNYYLIYLYYYHPFFFLVFADSPWLSLYFFYLIFFLGQ